MSAANLTLLLLLLLLLLFDPTLSSSPVVVTTWDFDRAAEAAWQEINRQGASTVDAVEV